MSTPVPPAERDPDRPADSPDAPGSTPTVFEPLCAVFRRTLKSEGLKYTPERARILDEVIGRSGLFTAEQITAGLSGAGRIRASKATVYRTIKLLADAGIIQQVLVRADQAHYQLAFGRGDSAVLVRTDRLELEPFAAPELAPIVERACAARGLTPHGWRLTVFASGGAQRPR